MAAHSELQTHLCSTCGQSFSRKSSFDKHCASVCVNPDLDRPLPVRQECKKKTKPFSCLLCHPVKRFAKSVNLIQHKSQFHGNASKLQRKVSCPHCENRYFRVYVRDRHVERVHKNTREEDGRKKWICDDCGEPYRDNKGLRQHRALMHPEADAKVRKFECDKCPRKFYTGWSLKKHLVTHEE